MYQNRQYCIPCDKEALALLHGMGPGKGEVVPHSMRGTSLMATTTCIVFKMLEHRFDHMNSFLQQQRSSCIVGSTIVPDAANGV